MTTQTQPSGFLVNDAELTSLEPIFKDLMKSEYHYMVHGLTVDMQENMHGGWADAVKAGKDIGPFPAQHFLCSVEVALVVAGIKPCSVINHGNAKAYGKLWFENVYQPWRLRHKAVLDRFLLNGKLLPDGEVARFTECDHGAHFGGSALVYRQDHALSSKILNRVFIENHQATASELQEVFGFPTRQGCLTLFYQLQPPVGERLGAPPHEPLCCGTVFEYTLDWSSPKELVRAGHHFETCRQALKKMGIPIGLDANNDNISSGALALLWLGACKGSVERYYRVQEGEDAYWIRPGHPDLVKTVTLMYMASMDWESYKLEPDAAP